MSALKLFNIIHKNAQITTSANTIFEYLYICRKANNAATIITNIVRKISDIHRPARPIFTSQALIFAIVATDIHHKYRLKGTCTKYLSHKFHSFFHNSILWPIIIIVIKKNNIMITDKNTSL